MYVKNGYQCKKPLVIYNVFNTKNDNNFFNQKIIINVEENSKLDLVIYSINLNSIPIFVNTSNYFLVELSLLEEIFRGSEGIMRITHASAGLRSQKTPENASRDQYLSIKKKTNEKYCLAKKSEQFFSGDLDSKIAAFR